MPSNLFATTGTSVSIMFIDKSTINEKVLLVEASDLGIKTKDGKNQRTLLTYEDIIKIQECFLNNEELENFSINVDINEITEKEYSLAASQYFDIKLEYSAMTSEEFKETIDEYSKTLDKLFNEKSECEKELKKNLGMMKYEWFR